jgi:hypothetical protein
MLVPAAAAAGSAKSEELDGELIAVANLRTVEIERFPHRSSPSGGKSADAVRFSEVGMTPPSRDAMLNRDGS